MSNYKDIQAASIKYVLIGSGIILIIAVLVFYLFFLRESKPSNDSGKEDNGGEERGFLDPRDIPDNFVLSEAEVVEGKAVVASTSIHATRIGLDILDRGGNAFDAAVAVSIALSVAEPHGSGLGGDGLSVYYDAGKGEYGALNWRSTTPLDFDISIYQDDPSLREYGMTAGVTPRAVQGQMALLERFGTMTWGELAEPSVDLARYGVEVCEFLANGILDNWGYISRDPETAAIFGKNGFPLGIGDIMINEDKAKILEQLIEKGPEDFYTGNLAEKIVAAMQAEGSPVSLADFEYSAVRHVEPVKSTYRGYELYSGAFPSSGICALQILNILEQIDMSAVSHESADRLHIIAEAARQSAVDWRTYVSDPDYIDADRVKGILAKSYAQNIAEGIDMTEANGNRTAVSSGLIDSYAEEYHQQWNTAMKNGSITAVSRDLSNDDFFAGSDSTTNFTIVDREGNAIVVTQSLGAHFGANKVIPGTGILLNEIMNSGSLDPSHTRFKEPGKVMNVGRAPTIAAKDGLPILAVGTAGGGRQPQAIAQVISNYFDYNLDLKEAVDSPLLYGGRHLSLQIEDRFEESIIEELRRRGHQVQVRGEREYFFSGLAAVSIDQSTGIKGGFGDLRRGGAAGALISID